jgi:circadian clock protein KaiC
MTRELLGRVPTHIPGLDTILEGGFLAGGVYMLEGAPGVGKTTLGSHFCFNHAARGGCALYITLLAESHTRLLSHLRRMSFFDASLVPERVSYVSAFKVLESEGLPSLLKLVRQTVTSQKISVVVLDGLISAEEASPSAREFKKFIHELQVITSMTGCVALLLNSIERPRGFRPERTMVDGILELEDEQVGVRAVRYLRVWKMRGASPVRGRHFLEISDQGMRVLPRIETVGVHAGMDRAVTPGPERAAFGIPSFDEMLQGGVPEASMTALVGPSGSGKTLLGLHFLRAGVERGERGIYYGFFERPAAVLEKSRRLGIELDEQLVQIHWRRPVESVIDELADLVIGSVKRFQARRLFLDGLQGFQAAINASGRLREVMACICDELENAGVTTVYSAETPDLLGDNLEISTLGMSALTHNIVLLRHTEQSRQTRRCLTVLKLRDSGHDLSVREFAITDRGIVVGNQPRTFGPSGDKASTRLSAVFKGPAKKAAKKTSKQPKRKA